MSDGTYTPEILFVDDEPAVLKAMMRLTRSEPWIMHFAESAAEGIKIVEERCIDIVVSDLSMPGMDGVQFLSYLWESKPEIGRILLTGNSDVAKIHCAVNLAKVSNFVAKPWNDASLVQTIEKTLSFQVLSKELLRLRQISEMQERQLKNITDLLNENIVSRNIQVHNELKLLS